MNIKGRSRYINLEGGFWGIESDNGKKYTPINMPEQLKTDGAKVEVEAVVLKDAMSMTMWGEVIRITSFSTLSVV